jgi:hypothetical protein
LATTKLQGITNVDCLLSFLLEFCIQFPLRGGAWFVVAGSMLMLVSRNASFVAFSES